MTLPKTSFAMVQTDVRTLEPRDIAIPDIDDDAAILQLEACGICGSDYEQFDGALNVPMGVIPGHEPLGRIAKIGDRAAQRWGLDVGDRVAVETMLSCRHCPTCFDGNYHLCDNRKIYSYIPVSEEPGLWGGYAQYMYLHPNSVLHKVSPDLPANLAVIFNPLGAGFRWATEIPQTRPGDTVVILGPGQRRPFRGLGLDLHPALRDGHARPDTQKNHCHQTKHVSHFAPSCIPVPTLPIQGTIASSSRA